MTAKRLAITMGDAAGVGPELCCRLAQTAEFSDHELIIYGNEIILERVAKKLNLSVPKNIVHLPHPEAETIQPGQIQVSCGELASACIEAAIADCLRHKVDAMVTAPVHKQALARAKAPFHGHTEWLQERCGAADSFMLMYDPRITVALATCHQSLASVPQSINSDALIRLGSLVHQFLSGLGINQAQLAVCGLNPHAGEGGLFGNEENTIQVAVDALRKQGINCTDPLPPDTAFTPIMRERYDAHLCMYHDQALIPFKSIAFDTGVNVTLGLPIVRSSVDHGTAFDIAWTGQADVTSLISATRVALMLAQK